jgi:general secretion pathway protein A
MTQWKGYGPDNVLPAGVGLTDATSTLGLASSALTYEPYYGLISKPFSLSTDPRTLYKSSSHAAVLEDLLAAIRRREGLIVLTGDMGAGKTTLCRAALYQLDRKTFSTFVPDPYLSREDLLRMLLVGFGEVSVEDLKQGRLKGTPRADLGCQLYEFLTSLESVDAFAVLVIDEAQNLSAPLLDEIRALSEMEAGRRLLQIVLVGQPELRARLTLPEMRQIAQRVTTSCELRPLTREAVNGYVAHRLVAAGGARDRVEFSSSALDLVFATSAGTPRLVNRICDRSLFHGYVDRASEITQLHVARALKDLELTPPRQQPVVPVRPPVAPVSSTTPGGLFVKTSGNDDSSSAFDLRALLDLPPVSRQVNEPIASPRTERSRMTGHRVTRSAAWWKRALTSLSLPALGMAVMLVAGGAAVSTAGKGTVNVDVPAVPARPPVFTTPAVRALPPGGTPSVAATVTTTVSAAAVASSVDQTWVVQVAAFSSPERSVAMVKHLADQGWPAYQVEPDSSTRGLTLVRVGPFESSAEADAVRVKLRATPAYEGAFVRNITQK